MGCGIYFIFQILSPTLPSAKKPFVIYATPIRSDLKLLYIEALKKAKKSIHLQIYGLQDPDLISLLQKKRQSGTAIQIFFDPTATKTLPSDLPHFPIQNSGLMHRKILVIDDQFVFLSTANLTTASLKMHDNITVGLYSQKIASFLQKATPIYESFFIEKIPLSLYLLPDPQNIAIQALCQRIREAKTSIHLALFTLTHPQILASLKEAKKRGVEITLIMDRNAAKGASKIPLEELMQEGIALRLGKGEGLLHHKWAFIDQKIFIFGSANWTKAAFSKNQDFLCIIDNLPYQDRKKLGKICSEVAKCSYNL